jgi:hypothetical protein
MVERMVVKKKMVVVESDEVIDGKGNKLFCID